MLEKIGLPAKPSLRGNNWVVDASHCQGCSSQFTFINRKHHCRRCGGLFCNSCTQQRLYLRGQGDSPVRICDPCKKLEEATRFEMRHGHKNRAGKGGSRVASKNEDEVLNQILGNDSKDLVSTGQETSDMLLSLQRASTSTSSSNVKEVAPKIEGEEIHRSFSTNVHNSRITDTESASPEELRQQAVEEKKKYKVLKAEGKPDEALRAFKRGKELERQAGALELELRKNRRKAMSSITMHEITVSKDESGRKSTFPEISKKKDDLSSELQELGWSENDLHDADKKPVNMTLEGELSSLIREVSQKTIDTEKVTEGIDKSGVIALKKRALALKREGKLGEAKEELKKAKLLEKQIEEQEFLVDAEDSDDELSSLIRSMDNDKQDDLFMKNDRDLDLNFSHLLNVDDGIGLDGNFEVTDDDMYDPDIAAALQSLGWSEDTSQHDETFSQIAPVDREGMLSEIQSLKREAVNKKRAGNTAEAMSLLKKAKALEADFATHNSDYGDLTTQNTTADTQKGLISQPVESSLKPDMGNKMVPKKSKLVIQRELLALKKKALALRREGKSDEAEEELKKGKALEQQLEEIENASNSKMKAPQENVGKKQTDITVSVDVEDEEEGDVTDLDMNDPSYLSLLQNLGWKEEESEKFHSPPKGQYSYSTHTVQVPAVVQKGGSRRSKGEIQRELLGLKRKSLALRRQGEVDEAEEVLRNASVLEAQLAEMEAPKQEVPVELENQKVDSFVKNLVDESVGVQVEEKIPLIVIQENPARSSETKEEIIQPTREEIIHMSEIPQLSVQQEILAHKRKAISLKREGRMAEAKVELRQAKLLEKNTEDKKTEPSASTSTSSSIVSSSNVALDPIEKKEHNFSSPPKLSSRDRFKMQQESLGHKRKALKLRREGRLQEAEAEFELAKALETQLEELNANDSTKSTTEHTEDAGVEDLLDPQLLSALREIGIESSGTQAPVPERTKPVKKQVADIPENAKEERIQLEERIKAEKVKAINLKRAGKQGEALDALRRAKLLQKKLDSLAS